MDLSVCQSVSRSVCRAVLFSPAELEFVSAASYGSGTTPGKLKLAHMVEGPLVGRHVLLIEDIIDSGRTVSAIAP